VRSPCSGVQMRDDTGHAAHTFAVVAARRHALRVLSAIVVVAAAAAIAWANLKLLALAADTNDPLGKLKAAMPATTAPRATTPAAGRGPLRPKRPPAQDPTTTRATVSPPATTTDTAATGDVPGKARPSRPRKTVASQAGQSQAPPSAVPGTTAPSAATDTSDSQPQETEPPEDENEPEEDD